MANTRTVPDIRPRVLLAARPDARVPFRHAINGDAEVIEAGTMADAIARLNGKAPIHLVCCTLFFDESRMFDLLRQVRADERYRHKPVVCVASQRFDTPISLQGLEIATRALAASAFIDFARHGDYDAGNAAIRSVVERFLGD